MAILDQLYDAILDGDDDEAGELTRRALAEGVDPQVIIDEAMVLAMAEAGRQFESQESFVPDLVTAGRAMKAALEPLRPLLAATGAQYVGRVVVCTVQGDLHDIGKNLVAAMLEGAGFEIIDLGVDASPNEITLAIEEHDPDLIGLSALLTTTMPSMKATIEAIESSGHRERVKVLIGGAPVNEAVAKAYGADAYAENANAAVRAALKLVET
ncbi:MAG: cobalamin-binding protein [Actinomycetia bacterium]|nr:cobalamin-binding protein [Actinomycetes bacterium]MCP5031047.1 cobalamin-binding protein [Actinomycetes bacterium]